MKKNCIILILTCLALTGYAQEPTFEWAKQMGWNDDDLARAITTDMDGNVYTTGYITNSEYYKDIFIQKLDANGDFLWSKQMGGFGEDQGWSITTDINGNVYTTGYFDGTVDFDPGPDIQNLTAAGDEDAFIQKLDTDGNFIWVKQMTGSEEVRGYSITTDVSGNICVTGLFQGIADFDPGVDVENLAAAGYYDIFVQKLDVNGNFIWAKGMGGSNSDVGSCVVTDADGNVYVTGFFSETVDFDPGAEVQNLIAVGYRDIFVQKLNADGNLLWVRQTGGNDAESGRSIAVDDIGNVYITGYFDETTDFDPSTGVQNLTSAGDYDAFVQKLDADGHLIWAKQMGGANWDIGNSIATDTEGNVYTTGNLTGTADFDPGPDVYNLTSEGERDFFIQKLDTDGSFLWAKRIGGANDDWALSLNTDASGNIYTAGFFEGTVDFNPDEGVQNLTSAGDRDIFIQKLSPCRFTSTDSQTACNAYIWIDGNTYTESNNTATFNIASGATNGCDSLVTLDLTINNVSDITTSVNGSTISANNSNATYQWLDCNNNNAPISGATNQDFTPTMNGNYAVEITENGCTETSACVMITTVGLVENYLEDEFTYFPNPTKGNFAIEFDKVQKNLNVRLFAVSGQLIENNNFQNTHLIQLEIDHPNGIYILEISDDDGNRAMFKLLKA